MDRKLLKAQAKESVANARGNAKIVTLLFLVALVVLEGLSLGVSELLDRTRGTHQYLSQTLSSGVRTYVLIMAIGLACQLVMVLFYLGYQSVALRICDQEEFDRGSLLDGFRIWGRGLMLYVYISLLLALWGSLLSIPASYVLVALYQAGVLNEMGMANVMMVIVAVVMAIWSYRYRMAYFLLLEDPEKPVRQILNEAKAINQTHRWHLFLLDMSFVPWLLLCVLTCGILLIWKLPYIITTYAHTYRFLQEDYREKQIRLEAMLEEQRRRWDPNYPES